MDGVDAEQSWKEKAEERSSKLNLAERTNYRVASAEALPFENSSFDLVTCQTLLMHVRDPLVVIQEMVRVLKPGGIFLAAEPNNFGSSAGRMVSEPPLPWARTVELLELEYFCAKGKRALGEGWSSIGEILPKYLAESGLTNINAKINNNCAIKLPPYDRPFDKINYQMMRDACDAGNSMSAGGTFENGQRMFVAGGGTEERFAYLWKQARKTEREILEQMDNNTFVSSGGYLHYLVWGRKPPAT